MLAVTSCLLTIYLTKSTTFITRKESGVLAPDFVEPSEASKTPDPLVEPKRKVMYYVRCPKAPCI
jgi:chloride channel 3/4/5